MKFQNTIGSTKSLVSTYSEKNELKKFGKSLCFIFNKVNFGLVHSNFLKNGLRNIKTSLNSVFINTTVNTSILPLFVALSKFCSNPFSHRTEQWLLLTGLGLLLLLFLPPCSPHSSKPSSSPPPAVSPTPPLPPSSMDF